MTAGGTVDVTVVAPQGEAPPERLEARLTSPSGPRLLILERIAGADGPARYRGTVSGLAAGLSTLSLADRPSTRLLLQVVVPSPLPEPSPAAAAEDRAPPAPPSPSLQANEPMYLILGSSGADRSVRFQLSFKYRLFDPEGLAASFVPGVARLHFAYTQNSLWDLSGDSKPFRDTSYRPGLFYEWPAAAGASPALSVRAGYEHESNGRAGADSRSIDTLYLRPAWRFDLERGNFLEVIPRLWGYIDREDNPDIARYRGYADLTLRAGDHQGLVGQLHLRRGTSGKGSAQFDLSYRLKRSLFADVGGFLHLQVFDGYGESILDYNRRARPEFRFGFSIVR